MFGGSTSDEGVWGFAALAQGVKGLGLGPGDVGGSVKPADFGGWRSKDDGEPDSPEGKGAATDVPVVEEEAQVGRLFVKEILKTVILWQQVLPRILMQDDGVIFSPNAISSPNKRVLCNKWKVHK